MQTDCSKIAIFGYDAGMVEVVNAQLRSDEQDVAAFTCPKLFSAALRCKDFDLIMHSFANACKRLLCFDRKCQKGLSVHTTVHYDPAYRNKSWASTEAL